MRANNIKLVARRKKSWRAASAGDFSCMLRLPEFDSLESPPSNSLRATRKPDVLDLSEIAGKGLVVVRKGISTPNAPYLR